MAQTHDNKARALQMLRTAPWLHKPATQTVFAALSAQGFAARCVGGAVRNTLLGLGVHDIDIATTATPQQVMAACAQAGLKVVATGLDHGTVTVLSGGIAYEVTTLRKDVETDGRHARIAFTTDWHVDAARRDFTMNALYCDADGTLFDPLDGYSDLMARRVRFINDPAARIAEDYLRILRFFRFNAQYGGADRSAGMSANNNSAGKSADSGADNSAGISAGGGQIALDEAGLRACIAARAGLAQLSAERIRAELLKLLAAPLGVAMCGVMSNRGLLQGLLGAAPRLPNLRRLAWLEQQLQLTADPLLRLAILSIAGGDDVRRLARRLKLSRREKATLALAADIDAPHRVFGHLSREGEASAVAADMTLPSEPDAKALQYYWGAETYQRRVLLVWANRTPVDERAEIYQAWRHVYDLPQRWQAPALPVSGADLMSLGMAQGPEIGACLRAFEQDWIAAGFPTASADYMPMLNKHLAAIQTGST